MNTAAYKRAAVCAMTEFGLSNLRTPSAGQTLAVEDYFAAVNANKPQKVTATAERYMAALRILIRCVKTMTRQQFAKVYIALEVIAAQDARKRP